MYPACMTMSFSGSTNRCWYWCSLHGSQTKYASLHDRGNSPCLLLLLLLLLPAGRGSEPSYTIRDLFHARQYSGETTFIMA